MITEAKIDEAVRQLFDKIEFPDEPAGLYDPLKYMIAIGGKRIRPKLCLTAYALFGGELSPEILEPAAGLEVFHTFTLIHDDIMDRSPLRRGSETVWKKWDYDTAILSGDVMCIDSYRRIAMAPKAVLGKALAMFSSMAAQVCEGQQLDTDFEKMESVSGEEYMKMIGLKTAVLIAASAKLGAMIAGADEATCNALYRYGYDLGLAFQVADDYLDAYGDSKVFGKPIGGDIINNKKCWLTVKAFEKTSDRAALLKALSLPAETTDEKLYKIQTVKDIYESLGIEEDAKYEILRLNSLALSHAEAVGKGSVRYEMLRRFADKLLGRTR